MLPGIFVALALRFDVSRGKGSQYFKSAFLGYAFGLILTIVVMNWFQAAQVGSLCFLMFPEQMNNYSLDNKLYHFLNVSIDQNILFSFSTFHPNMTLLLALSIVLFQPALLYIVPSVIGFLAVHVIWNGDIKPVCIFPMTYLENFILF